MCVVHLFIGEYWEYLFGSVGAPISQRSSGETYVKFLLVPKGQRTGKFMSSGLVVASLGTGERIKMNSFHEAARLAEGGC
jgi:hypothetical protein